MVEYVYDKTGRKIDFDVACLWMDDDLRIDLFMQCMDFRDSQKIFDTYTEMHKEKFGVEFVV